MRRWRWTSASAAAIRRGDVKAARAYRGGGKWLHPAGVHSSRRGVGVLRGGGLDRSVGVQPPAARRVAMTTGLSGMSAQAISK
jgi:hypothetical protein